MRSLRAMRPIAVALLMCGCTASAPSTATPGIGPSPVPAHTDTSQPDAPASHLPATNTPDPTATAFVTWTPQPTETPFIARTLAPAPPLSPTGPWLLFTASSDRDKYRLNLWAVNADGSNMNKLVDENVLAYAVQPRHAPGADALVAYVTTTSIEARGLVLHLLHLPGGRTETITPLINDRQGGPPVDIGFAQYAVRNDGLAWSADGQNLAFVGQIDGPSMDVYRYEVATGSLHWLSSGESQAFQLEWSPDQQRIIHQGFTFVGMGGADVSGIWSARADGGGSTILMGGDNTSDTLTGYVGVMGWQDTTHILLFDLLDDVNGTVTSVDVTDGTARTILSTVCANLAYSPRHDLWLLASALDPDDPDIPIPPRLVHNGTITEIPGFPNLFYVWWLDGQDEFLGATNAGKFYTISISGLVTPSPMFASEPLAGENIPNFEPAPDGTLWKWDTRSRVGGSMFWVGEPLADPKLITSGNVEFDIWRTIWSPDSQRLFLFAPNGLWVAERPDFKPVLVVDGSYVESWLGSQPQWAN